MNSRLATSVSRIGTCVGAVAHPADETALPRDPGGSVVLRALARERARVLAKCEPVSLAFGEILARPGDIIRWAYFPTGG